MNFKKNLFHSFFVLLILFGFISTVSVFSNEAECHWNKKNYKVKYQVHVNHGWQRAVTDGKSAGVKSRHNHINGIRVELGDKMPDGIGVSYRVYDGKKGWLSWKSDWQACGTNCCNSGIIAVQIKLINAKSRYMIKYKVRKKGQGWTDWKYDGETAGDTNSHKYMKSIRIKIVKANKPKKQYALLAENSIYMRSGGNVAGGHVAVINVSSGPVLEGTSEVVMDNVTLEDGVDLYADKIKLKGNSSVFNVYYNDIINYGTIRGEEFSPLELPLQITLPKFPKPSGNLPANAENISVALDETQYLEPGVYKDINLEGRGVLILTGGLYEVENITMAKSAKVYCQNSTDVVIQNRFESGENSVIQPEEGSTATAKDFVFYIKGQNGDNGQLDELPKAATIGVRSKVKANFFVPNGTLWLKARGTAEGSFIGRDIMVEFYVQITLNSPFFF